MLINFSANFSASSIYEMAIHQHTYSQRNQNLILSESPVKDIK